MSVEAQSVEAQTNTGVRDVVLGMWQALSDRDWQTAARRRLVAASARLAASLDRHGLRGGAGTALFQWRPHADARAIHTRLAEQGILTRLFDTPSGLRFGLPGDETGWSRLTAALAQLRID